MNPIFFESPAAFRRWLQQHHTTEREVWVGFHRKHTGRQTMTWQESVAEALCFGWIDGVRKSVDGDRYTNRFTPRRPGSNWSEVNIRLAEDLIARGRMRAEGRRAFEARRPDRSGVYSFEQRNAPVFDADSEAAFRKSPAAWQFFASQPPGYRRLTTFWVVSAKKPETRARRLAALIADSAAGCRIGPLNRDEQRRPSAARPPHPKRPRNTT